MNDNWVREQNIRVAPKIRFLASVSDYRILEAPLSFIYPFFFHRSISLPLALALLLSSVLLFRSLPHFHYAISFFLSVFRFWRFNSFLGSHTISRNSIHLSPLNLRGNGVSHFRPPLTITPVGQFELSITYSTYDFHTAWFVGYAVISVFV